MNFEPGTHTDKEYILKNQVCIDIKWILNSGYSSGYECIYKNEDIFTYMWKRHLCIYELAVIKAVFKRKSLYFCEPFKKKIVLFKHFWLIKIYSYCNKVILC